MPAHHQAACVSRYTGRIGSRRQPAKNVRPVSLGCSGGAQLAYGDHPHIIQRCFKGKPILRKMGRFSLYAFGNGVNLPHACGQAHLWRPNWPQCSKSHAIWQSFSSGTEKLRTFQIYIYFILDSFRAHRGDFCGFHAAGHILWLVYFMTVLATPRRLNDTWVHVGLGREAHHSQTTKRIPTYKHANISGIVPPCPL